MPLYCRALPAGPLGDTLSLLFTFYDPDIERGLINAVRNASPLDFLMRARQLRGWYRARNDLRQHASTLGATRAQIRRVKSAARLRAPTPCEATKSPTPTCLSGAG